MVVTRATGHWDCVSQGSSLKSKSWTRWFLYPSAVRTCECVILSALHGLGQRGQENSGERSSLPWAEYLGTAAATIPSTGRLAVPVMCAAARLPSRWSVSLRSQSSITWMFGEWDSEAAASKNQGLSGEDRSLLLTVVCSGIVSSEWDVSLWVSLSVSASVYICSCHEYPEGLHFYPKILPVCQIHCLG